MEIFKPGSTTWTILLCSVLLLPGSIIAQESKNGKRLYLTYCSGCHGSSGKGDGPAAEMLPVKPVDHTSVRVMSQLSDEYLFQIISRGGKKVGKSSDMPAWGAILKPQQVKDVIAYIRVLSGSTDSEAENKRK